MTHPPALSNNKMDKMDPAGKSLDPLQPELPDCDS